MGPYYLTALVQAFGPIARVAARGAGAGPTRVIGKGPRAGEAIAVGVPTYVAALYDFAGGGVAQATFSFDSPLERMGVVEIAGSEATIVAPDPNHFTGTVRIARGGAWEDVPVPGPEGGRGIGAVDMARGIRGDAPHRATGRLGLHVLEAMLATAASAESGAFVAVAADGYVPAAALPAGWDPTERTLG